MADPPPTSPRAAGMTTALHNDRLVKVVAVATRRVAPARGARADASACDARRPRAAGSSNRSAIDTGTRRSPGRHSAAATPVPKQPQRFMTGYAQDEARRADLDI